jgi:hypothetical protein
MQGRGKRNLKKPRIWRALGAMDYIGEMKLVGLDADKRLDL